MSEPGSGVLEMGSQRNADFYTSAIPSRKKKSSRRPGFHILGRMALPMSNEHLCDAFEEKETG